MDIPIPTTAKTELFIALERAIRAPSHTSFDGCVEALERYVDERIEAKLRTFRLDDATEVS